MVQSRGGLPGSVRQGVVFLALVGLLSPRPSPAGDDLPPPSDQDLVVADVDCPVAAAPSHGGRYPNVHGLDREARSAFARSAEPARAGAPYAVTKAYRNPVDQEIFGQLAASGIQPTVRSSDAEFLRRVMLDLTGRVPPPADVLTFVADTRADKRGRLIDTLLASDAFVDRWALWFGDLVENVRTTTANGVEQGPGRNALYFWTRGQIAAGVPYDQMVRDLVSATGDSFAYGPANFIVRNLTTMGVTQDNYDNWAANTGEKFLGVPLNCSGCHNGAGHSPNLYVQLKTRMDFWKNAAFFAQTSAGRTADFATGLNKYNVANNTTGAYLLNTTTGNRPARQPVAGQSNRVDPAFYLTGETPAAGKPLRAEYARMLTSHPQFARAAVNYLFKEMFGIGIVDPPDSFDLLLQDPANLPPGQTLQPSHPALLNRLQSAFVASGYDLRSILRTIANSDAYQLSARYTPGTWNETWTRTFARRITRRVPAEALLDAITSVSGVPVNLTINSSTAVPRAMLLPDPTEGGGGPATFMNSFLRGNRDTNPRSGDVSTIQALALMNDGTVVSRVQNATAASLVSRTLKATQKPDEIVNTLWLATLARVPTDAEKASAVAYLKTATATSPLAAKTENLQWTLFNKLEFLFY
jgi:hypothetical protein